MQNENLLPIGATLQNGKYRVEQQLASGGFGNTYKVLNVEFEEVMAMKEFYLKGVNERDSDSKMVSVSNAENTKEFDSQKEKFRKEAQRLRKLDNDHVVHVYDLFEENGTAYYVMDFLEGKSLSARMKEAGHPYDEATVIDYTRQVLDALETVHSENIWHLDLKPGNIMTDSKGRAVLIDFGASKQFHDSDGRSLSTSTGLCYTPGYAPTEQIEANTNRMGPWTDLYALGATMYNMLTMKTPPSVSDIQDGEGFNFPETTSVETRRMIKWMMEPDRKRRPQSVAEVKRFIEARYGGTTPSASDEKSEETKIHHDAPISPTPQDASIRRPVADRPAQQPSTPVYVQKEKSKLPWIIGGIAAVVVLLLLIACVIFIVLMNRSSNSHMPVDMVEPPVEMMDSLQWEEMHDSLFEEMVVEDVSPVEDLDREDVEVAQSDVAIGAVDYDQGSDEDEHVLRQNERIVEEAPPAVEESRVFEVVEQMPQYPGGDAALTTFLAQHVKYPAVAEENGIQGRVVCTFVVERDGSISDVRVVKSVDPSLDKEAVRVLKSMPRWVPGKQNGATVRVIYTVPVTFRLQ